MNCIKFFLGCQNYGFITFLISREENDFFLGKIFHYLFIPKKKRIIFNTELTVGNTQK